MDQYGQKLGLRGRIAPVHKPLLAAGEVTDKANAVWLDGDGGFVIHANSPAMREVRAAVEKAMAKHGGKGCFDLFKERGVYNTYVKIEQPVDGTQDICPNEVVGPGGDTDFHRRSVRS